MPLLWVRSGLLLLALVASALSAGFFYTYSVSVMPGLSAADPHSAVRTMQAINAVIRTPWFAFAFFGPLLLPLLVAVVAWVGRAGRLALLAAASGVAYGLGVFAVTFLINVPLNEGLAAANPTSDTAARIWSEYAARWTPWNHVRALAALLSFVLMVAATVEQAFPPSSPT